MSAPPARPSVGVGGVLIQDDRVLLIRRGKEPLRGRWVVPGGTVELGETLEQALIRELQEETGLRVLPLEVLTVFDRIHREGGAVSYHYVIIDYLCTLEGGALCAGSDALEAAFAPRGRLADYDLPPKALEVVEQAFTRVAARAASMPPPRQLVGGSDKH